MNDYEVDDALPMVAEQSMIATLNKSEIDQQITTAKQYPRSIVKFRKEALQMVTLNERVAESCIYALPRGDKTIEGASARFAEIVASAWGNCRAGARTISDQGDFVTAQGVFHDLERNVAITYEVQRRILDKNGRRYSPDMIVVTSNAACSIALRNAILKGVPKAFWDDLYVAARETVMGDFKTLANRRATVLEKFLHYGISKEKVCATLGVAGPEDIGLDHLVTLRGLLTAIHEGDTTPEQAFGGFSGPENGNKPPVKQPQSKSAQAAPPTPPATEPETPPPATETPPPPAPEKPAAEPAKASKPAPASSNDGNGAKLATDGEKAFLTGKVKRLQLSLDDVLAGCGLSSMDGLTADGFIAMKDYLTEQEKG